MPMVAKLVLAPLIWPPKVAVATGALTSRPAPPLETTVPPRPGTLEPE